MNNWFDYYKIQYDRIKQHEDQRMQFSNIVIITSSAIFTFGARLGCDQVLLSILLYVLVFSINWAALKFIDKARCWVKFHQKRARVIMEKHAEEFQLLIDSVGKPDSDLDSERRPEIHKILHKALMGLAIAFPLIQLLSNS